MTNDRCCRLSVVSRKSRAGFTLVELIVAMSVFLIAVTIAVGAFIQSLKTQRTVNHLLSVNSNASLVLEKMAREVRTGYNFAFNDGASGACSSGFFGGVEFTNSRNNRVFYHSEDGVITRRECTGDDCSASQFEPITASNVFIERLCFVNTGDLNNESDPWRITMFLKVGSNEPSLSLQFLDIQTTVAARIIPEELP